MLLRPAALLLAITSFTFAHPTPPPKDLEQTMKTCFEKTAAPGAVYGYYLGKELTPAVRLNLGFADEQHTRPICFDDHFRIASITKVFTGQVILQLLDEGKLSLDDPISKYVDGVPKGEKITIKMLGHHTSGIPSAIGNEAMQKAILENPARSFTTQESLAYAYDLGFVRQPGEAWVYSNTNTQLLGLVIEKITGKSWQEEVRSRLIDKLKLTRTGFPDETGRLPAPAPKGYRYGRKENLVRYGDVWYDATNWSANWAGASGDMYSTLDDMAVFIRAAATGEMLGEKGRAALFDWQDAKYEGISQGFHLFRQNGAVGSVGDVPGFSAIAVYLPEHDVTIICLANLTATKNKLTAAAELGELTVKLLNDAESSITKPVR